ncbi:general transcription factor IIH [Pelomyxa schiedti]|nr:general transcription factor IIH [Pelomyxa schiedti]
MDNEDASLLVVLMDTSPIVWSGSASVTGSPSPSPAAADSPMAESAEATPTATSSSSAQPATTPSGRGIVGRGFADTVSQLCSFINAFLLLNAKNRLAVIACHAWESRYIFPTVEEPDAPDETPDRLVRTRSALLHQISLLPSVVPSSATSESSVLSSALSLALCYINRITRVSPTLKPRILCLNASPDISAQYIPVMNCIFAAQRKDKGNTYRYLHPG